MQFWKSIFHGMYPYQLNDEVITQPTGCVFIWACLGIGYFDAYAKTQTIGGFWINKIEKGYNGPKNLDQYFIF